MTTLCAWSINNVFWNNVLPFHLVQGHKSMFSVFSRQNARWTCSSYVYQYAHFATPLALKECHFNFSTHQQSRKFRKIEFLPVSVLQCTVVNIIVDRTVNTQQEWEVWSYLGNSEWHSRIARYGWWYWSWRRFSSTTNSQRCRYSHRSPGWVVPNSGSRNWNNVEGE